ncbi:holin [Alkalibaculum sp. M08DMB]|uniref:Holin n=1 Tax=Alkalibaculum sporogenes TaxID=2655001 RepID=A0A6A7K9V3_9FIRM|nr:holin [Alkalibaculum sporogenes]
MKAGVLTTIGIAGSMFLQKLGGWDMALQTLVFFMVIDYLTGLVVAGVFNNSTKTVNGKLESRAGFKGLFRKGMTLLIVFVAAQLDLLTGTQFIRNAVIIAYVVNEAISIVENAGYMGIDIPAPLSKAIESLNNKEVKGTGIIETEDALSKVIDAINKPEGE